MRPYIAYTKNTRNMSPNLQHVYFVNKKNQGNVVYSQMLESPGQLQRKLTGRYADYIPINQLINKIFINQLPYIIYNKSSVLFNINTKISFNAPLSEVKKYLNPLLEYSKKQKLCSTVIKNKSLSIKKKTISKKKTKKTKQ